MHLYVYIALIKFLSEASANPLPLDSVDLDPYLLALVDPESAMANPRNSFIPDSFQNPSFSSTQDNIISSSQFASQIDLTEPIASTDLTEVPCKTDQISDASAAGKDEGICKSDGSTGESEQQSQPSPTAEEPERADPAVSAVVPQSDSEDVCDPESLFIRHYCCDGLPPGGLLGRKGYLSGIECYLSIGYCLPCGS